MSKRREAAIKVGDKKTHIYTGFQDKKGNPLFIKDIVRYGEFPDVKGVVTMMGRELIVEMAMPWGQVEPYLLNDIHDLLVKTHNDKHL